MHARVDKEKCVSCQLCPEICPEVFEMQDDGLAGVKVDPVPEPLEDACRDAASQCPTEAIEID